MSNVVCALYAGVQSERVSQHRAADDSGEVCELLAAVAADQPGGGAAHLRPHGVPGPHVHTQGAGRHGHAGKCLAATRRTRRRLHRKHFTQCFNLLT